MQDGNAALLAHFARKCDEYGLRYWLDYGSLLGAVRHKGVIPWDDDMDISMLRSDYEKLLELMPEMFPREEGFHWNSHGFTQLGYDGTPLNLDITPYHAYFEKYSDTAKRTAIEAMRNIKKKVILVGGSMSCSDAALQQKIKSEVMQGKEPLPESDKPMLFLSPMALFAKYMAVPYDMVFPLKKVEFLGYSFTAPCMSRKWLQEIYGDYMNYPGRVGYWHKHLEGVVKNAAFDDRVNEFIDKYGQ